MKHQGVVRRVDNLGRLVLPAELRRALKIGKGDPVEYYRDGDTIVLKKFDAAGDLGQILENAERSIRQQEAIAPDLTKSLLIKIEEMKIVLENSKGE